MQRQEFCINSVETKGKSENDWNVSVYCEGKQVNMKIDTDAQCNVMSMQAYQSISKKPLQKSKTKLITYSGHKISTAGKTSVTVTHKGKFYAVPFQIVDKNVATILGSQSSSDMNMVSRIYAVNVNNQTSHDIIKDYAEVFEGL